MKRFVIIAALLVLACACSRRAERPRTVEDFNFDWRFTLGDDPLASGTKDVFMYDWASPGFDDSGWRQLHLPHDWSIEGEFSPNNPSGTSGGALPGGVGWYRKHFETPEGVSQGKVVSVEFDGVFMNSTVFVNGHPVGTRPYGYSSFSYDITPYLNPEGEDNVIAVRCDNAEQPNSRWYAGCGIYRNVRLVTTGAIHVAWSGTFVNTPSITSANALVAVEVTLENSAAISAQYFDNATVTNLIRNDRGGVVARGEPLSDPSGVVHDTLTIVKPHLWDIDDTYQYILETTVKVDDEITDVYTTRFGIRTAELDADKGFLLNGHQVKLLGVCLHNDMGCIGTAVHFRALQRELEILKSFGVNAIRTSHNPPAPELLQLADDMGFLVLDEAFDMWRKRKTRYDYARFYDDWHEIDLGDFIRRDRNHPSVFMWSLANEIAEQGDSQDDNLQNLSPEEANYFLNFIEDDRESALEANVSPNVILARHMADIVRKLDPTRPLTAGCNHPGPTNNLVRSGMSDAFGINYHTSIYDESREWFPEMPIYGSETASAINSRGVYPQPSTDTLIVPSQWWLSYESDDHQLPAYDNCRVPWGELHEEAWVRIRDREWMAGTFVWTGFDYIGEPTPFGWPSRSSYFGIVDLAGFPKDCYWMYKSEWTDETVLHVFPHWNWSIGDKVDIWAYYNNADEVELFVNGKSYGRDHKEGEKLHAQWNQVPFETGKIEVVSYRRSRVVARESRETTGEPVALKLTADRGTIHADGYDLSYITVEAVDSKGRPVPTADLMLDFSVTGAGELFGVDNGNPADVLCLKGDRKPLFSGKALAVIRSFKGIPGSARLTVNSELGSTHIDIKVK